MFLDNFITRIQRKIHNLVLILIIFLYGCSPALRQAQGNASPSPVTVPASEAPTLPATFTPAPDYVTRLRNAPYQLGATDALRVIQLTDGKYEQGVSSDADYVSVTVADFIAAGDLNNDSVDEVVALIAENYGGTGVFTFLVVYAEVNGALAFQTSAYVDDRPDLNALSIADGEIFLDAMLHTQDDPLCCPTFRITRHYRMGINNQLDISDYSTFTPDNRPRLITIDSPLNGADAYGSVQIKGNVMIAPFENNLIYRVYDIGGVELASGFITVNAAELGGPGTFDAIIALSGMLSGAVVRIEVQDVSAEDGSLLAMDSVELVVK